MVVHPADKAWVNTILLMSGKKPVRKQQTAREKQFLHRHKGSDLGSAQIGRNFLGQVTGSYHELTHPFVNTAKRARHGKPPTRADIAGMMAVYPGRGGPRETPFSARPQIRQLETKYQFPVRSVLQTGRRDYVEFQIPGHPTAIARTGPRNPETGGRTFEFQRSETSKPKPISFEQFLGAAKLYAKERKQAMTPASLEEGSHTAALDQALSYLRGQPKPRSKKPPPLPNLSREIKSVVDMYRAAAVEAGVQKMPHARETVHQDAISAEFSSMPHSRDGVPLYAFHRPPPVEQFFSPGELSNYVQTHMARNINWNRDAANPERILDALQNWLNKRWEFGRKLMYKPEPTFEYTGPPTQMPIGIEQLIRRFLSGHRPNQGG